MAKAVRTSHVVTFGVFEVDLDKKEVRKNGLKLKLRGQPFHVLAILLEHAGEVVTREEFQQRLWTSDATFVDFEHSLNAGVKRLRAILSDSSEHPRYIETQARRGYRFIAAVDRRGVYAQAPAEVPPASVETAQAGLTAWSWTLVATIALCIVGLLGWGWHRWPNRPIAATRCVAAAAYVAAWP